MRMRLRLRGATLATPTLAIQSATGAAPLVLQWSDTDYVAGYYGQLQIDQTSNAFGAITQNIVFFIDGTSWALNDEAIGLVTPSGAYWARIRVCRENESGATSVTGNDPLGNSVTFNADASAWSNTVNDTITAVTTIWNTATKNANLTVSGSPALTLTGPAGFNGSPAGVRATNFASGKRHWELTMTSFASSNPCYIGIEDGTVALTGFPNPPATFTGYRTDGVLYKNGSVLSGSTSAAAGNVLVVETDSTGATMSLWLAGTSLGTITGITASAYYPYSALEDADSFTANFGQNTFTRAPSTGYSGMP
jgi:hypothetical protein